MGLIKGSAVAALLTLMGCAFSVHAADIVILGLFKNKVVLTEGGERFVLKVGDKTPQGTELVSADSQEAVLKVHGQAQTYTLGTQIQSSYSKATLANITIEQDASGMYRTEGAINGKPMRFLVDSGAQLVAMNAKHAQSIGLEYKSASPPIMVDTASGQSPAYLIELDSISVGSIKVHNVKAMVIENETYPKEVLLGMSFLKNVDMTHQSHGLLLQKKY